MIDEMRAVATELLRTNHASANQEFTVTGSTDRVVVTVTRINDERKRAPLIKLSEAMALVPYGSGQTCGACSGTGRV